MLMLMLKLVHYVTDPQMIFVAIRNFQAKRIVMLLRFPHKMLLLCVKVFFSYRFCIHNWHNENTVRIRFMCAR